MAKQFGGFTDTQKEVLARKMGFNGPMDQFGNFLQSSPANQSKFLSYEDKAKQMVMGGAPQLKPKPAFATGGAVTPNPLAAAPGTILTNQAITNPSSLVTQVNPVPLTTAPDQFVDNTAGQMPMGNAVTPSTVAPTAQATDQATTPAPTVQTATVAPSVEAAASGFQAAQGTVSQNAQVVAATAQPSANATVQGQLAGLMQQFEGGETPAWAAGAIRNANGIMAQRGLGSSSIAAGAVTQAAMESAIGIAAQDANTFSQFEMANLNNRQQARLVNAQSFLQMDLANMDADQQMTMFKSQSIIQGLFTDQAAENASRQFNASSQGQTDQFFANLKSQVSQFNAAQGNAMEQFKVGQKDSLGQFNRQMNDATEQFNAQNRLVIDQSNAEWRRAVTTANNATANETNRLNAQAATGMTLAGYNNLMQRERDLYSFAFQSSENAADRAANLATNRMNISASNKQAAGAALGSLAGAAIGAIWRD